MSKHTPGPWVEDRDDYDVEHGEFPGWIRGADGAPVVEYAGCGSHKAYWPNPADKALALAAPELLEALRDIYTINANDYFDGGMSRARAIALDAIAKATGGSHA